MNTRTLNRCFAISAAVGAAVAVAPLASAQQTMRHADQKQMKTDHQDKTAAMYMKAGQAIGAEVANMQDEDLGEIDDILLDRRTGKSKYALISSGGMLGMGDTVRAIPYNALRWDQDKQRYVVRLNKDQLKNIPEFDRDKWSALDSDEWRRSVDQTFGTDADRDGEGAHDWDRDDDAIDQRNRDRARDGGEGAHDWNRGDDATDNRNRDYEGDNDRDSQRRNADRTQDRTQRDADRQGERMARDRDQDRSKKMKAKDRFILASTIDGTEILGSGGNEIATTESILIDANRTKPAFLTASTGGMLSMGDTIYVLPWQAVRIDQQDRFHLQVAEDDLKAAPTLKDREITALNEQNFRNRVYSHFGVDARQAEWSDDDAMRRDRGDTARNRSLERTRNDEYTRMFRNGQETTVSGRIVEQTRARLADQNDDFVVITVRDSSDKTHTVHLLPSRDMRAQGVEMDNRTRVEVTGRRVRHNGETFIIAEELKVGDKACTLRGSSGEMARR